MLSCAIASSGSGTFVLQLLAIEKILEDWTLAPLALEQNWPPLVLKNKPSQDAHSQWNNTDGVRKWCGQSDSLQHRYFERANTDLRLTAPLVAQLRGLPDAMVLRSLAL